MKRKDLQAGDRVMLQWVLWREGTPEVVRCKGTVMEVRDGMVKFTSDPDENRKAFDQWVTRAQCTPLKKVKKTDGILGQVTGVSKESFTPFGASSIIKVYTNEPCDVVDQLIGKHVRLVKMYPADILNFKKQLLKERSGGHDATKSCTDKDCSWRGCPSKEPEKEMHK